jgi:hypothetical protein
MKCDKSYKRAMLVRWGIQQLQQGKAYDEVTAAMAQWRRRTVADVQRMLTQTGAKQ